MSTHYEMALLDFVFTRDTDKMKKVLQWYADQGITQETLTEWYERIRVDLPDEEERALECLDMITGWAGNSDYHIKFGEVTERPNVQSC